MSPCKLQMVADFAGARTSCSSSLIKPTRRGERRQAASFSGIFPGRECLITRGRVDDEFRKSGRHFDYSESNEQELRDHAAKRLTDLKVPENIVFLPSLPKGVTGKIQRRALKSLLFIWFSGVRSSD